MVLVHLHGAPGGPGEIAALLPPEAAGRFHVPDRFALAPGRPYDEMIAALARDLATFAPGEPLRLVGFSLGARAAIEVALRLPGRVERIDLVSAAAPFELGDFLPRMAGRPVFEAARDRPGALRALLAVQGAMGRFAPGLLHAMLFHGVAGEEAVLAGRPAFRAAMTGVFATAYGAGRAGFVREIAAALEPWSDRLAGLDVPVRLHHGASDGWTPPDMAEALRRALPRGCEVEILDGLGHYSTAARVLADLAAAQT